MAKLNTYQLQSQLAATLQLIGIIPGEGSSFETVRLSNAALVSFIQQYAGEDGSDGREIELRAGSTNIEWRYAGATSWTALIAINDLKGAAGEQVQLQANSTHIQWKYSSAPTWTNLVALVDLKGTNGTNGRTMWSVSGAPSSALGVDGDFANDATNSIMYGPKTSGSWGTGTSYKGVKGDTGTGLTNRSAWVSGTVYNPGDYVFSTGSATTSSMWILNGEVAYTSNTLPKNDLTHWVEFVAPAGADGEDGKSVEMRKTATVIQWRLVGDSAWTDLVTLADLKGADGDDGTNGNTVLSTTGAPSSELGVNGDFANDVTNSVMYGPKAGGVWPAGVSYKGGPGDAGAAGSKWLTGSGVPASGTGANGDFYLRDTGDVYGPKTAGAWGAVVASLKGTKGDTGAGVPAGGTAGQVLTKKSATDGDTEWKTPSSGGGGSGDVTAAGDNVFTGDNQFKGVVDFNNTMVIQSVRSIHPSTGTLTSGSTVNIPLGVEQVLMNSTADLAALTLNLPAYAQAGSRIRLYFKHAVAAVTITTESNWAGPIPYYGTLSEIKPGSVEFQYFEDSHPGWYLTN